MSSNRANGTPASSSWRLTLPIHPAAELFPRMSPDELRALGEDVVKSGLKSPIVLWRPDSRSLRSLLDGISRLDAIEIATGSPVMVGAPSIMAGEHFLACDKVIVLDKSVDPYAYVISANIHRRHLTAEQKRELISKLIKATPEKSDRQIAETVKASPTTVGTVRAEMEAAGDVSKLDTRRDRRGRQQPAKKAKKAAKKKPAPSEPIKPVAATSRGDIGATSTGEAKRLAARNEELENKCRQLELKVAGLESEVEKLKAENAALRAKLEAAPEVAPEVTQEVVVAAAASTVTAGDPGPFPEILRREPEATGASSSGGPVLGDVLTEAFDKINELASDCSNTVESLSERFSETTRVQNLDDTTDVLEDLIKNKPDVAAELASIKIDLPKHRKPRSYGDRQSVVFGMLAAACRRSVPSMRVTHAIKARATSTTSFRMRHQTSITAHFSEKKPPMTIHTPKDLQAKNRRLDRRLAEINDAAAALRAGAALHFAYRPTTHWTLSTGVTVTDETAHNYRNSERRECW